VPPQVDKAIACPFEFKSDNRMKPQKTGDLANAVPEQGRVDVFEF